MTQTRALIAIGDSQRYDDRLLWKLLEETGLNRDDFEDLDYFSLPPFFVLAGALAQIARAPARRDHSYFLESVTFEIDPSWRSRSLRRPAPDLLAQLVEDDED